MKNTQGEWKIGTHPFLHVESGEQWICQPNRIELKNPHAFLSDEWDAEEKRKEAEQMANLKLIAGAPEMFNVLDWINLKYGDIEGERELSPVENHMIERVREVLSAIR